MDVNLIIAITFGLLLVLLILEVPVAFALAIAGAVGLLFLQNFDYVTNVLGSVPFTESSSFTLTMIPMFILMGVFAVKGRIAEHVFAIANRASNRLPGGLGVATVMACAGFSAVSGSSMATAATMSRMSIKEMRKYGYPDHLAAGIVAVAGTLGVMIPPSIFLVLYAVLSNESPARMLAAGILPGIISAVAYIVYIMVVGKRQIRESQATLDTATRELAGSSRLLQDNGSATGGTATATAVREEAPSPLSRERLPWRGLFRVGVLFLVVMGGLYSGIVTATESAAIGALAALVMLLLELRRDGMRSLRVAIVDALKESAETTSMIFFVIVGSGVLSTFFIASRLPFTISEWVGSLDVAPVLIVLGFLLILIPMGMALESISILVIVVPLMHPVVTDLGFDGVWFGILVVKLIELGLVTPPVGMSCFVVAGTAGVPVERVFRGVLPLVLVDVAVIALLFLVPQITLWLPSMVVN